MATCVFDKCCGCIDLKTGCFIIGYLQLVGEIIYIVMLTLGLIAGSAAAASDTKDENVHNAGVVVAVLCGILLVFVILALAFTITLLIGLHKDKRGHLKAYMIFSVIFIVIGIVMFFAGFANSKVDAPRVVTQVLSTLLSIYFLLVIRSQYLKMDTSKGPAIYNTA